MLPACQATCRKTDGHPISMIRPMVGKSTRQGSVKTPRHRLVANRARLMSIPAANDEAVASAMPRYPIAGKGGIPKARAKSPAMLTRLTKNIVSRGFFTSPAARKTAFAMMSR